MSQLQKLQIVKGEKKKATNPKDEWGTPPTLYNWAGQFFDFTLDAAASAETHLCKKYYSKKKSGLKKNWKVGAKGGDVWLNHPYSMNNVWIRKCNKEAKRGGFSICNLGPADTSSDYFRLYLKYARVYLIIGRIKYVGADNMATFSNAFYVFGKDPLASKYNPNGEKISLITDLSPFIRGGVRK